MKIREMFLPFAPPYVAEGEIAAASQALRSDWLTTGPKTKEFEKVFSETVGAQGALALNSCTAGLHIALLALGVKPGDEVITSPMTFCASANVIEHVGAKVVLADIEPDTLLLNPKEVAKKITKNTKVILPVHYAGHPVDLTAIESSAKSRDISILEDAAHAYPAYFEGKMIGGGNHLTAFSFYANKNITTTEGGMLCGPAALVDSARELSLHGMSRDAWKRFDAEGSWRYDVVAPGYKYNMTDVQASIGLVQLSRTAELYSHRMQIVNFYQESFKEFPFLETPVQRPNVQSSWHLYVIRLNLKKLTISRDQFIKELKARNIGSSVHYIPLYEFTFYKNKYGFNPKDFPVTSSLADRILSLPLSSRMTIQDAKDVVEAVKDICHGQKSV